MMGKMFSFIRFFIFKVKWKIVNKHNYTFPGNYIDVKKVSIGKYTYGKINALTSGNESEYLKIGHFCSIASTAKFMLAGEHSINSISTYPFKQKFGIGNDVETISNGPIIVNDDVWIAENALILSGVEIGQGAVIAAGAVVTKNVPPYAVVGGVPAKLIKYRFDEETINNLMKIDFENLTKDEIITNLDSFYSCVDNKTDLSFLPQRNGLGR